jgi:hypothetical protein
MQGQLHTWLFQLVTPKKESHLMSNSTTRPKNSSTKKSSLPAIQVSGRRLREVSDNAIKALDKANIPPLFYVRSGMLVRFITDEHQRPKLEPVDETMVTSRLARIADFNTRNQHRKITPCDPPPKVSKDILAIGSWPFPLITGIVEAPIIRPDGSIVIDPGYDPITGLYYHPAPSFNLIDVPEHPSKASIDTARNVLLGIFEDFPFKDEASRANTLGLVITPFMRPAIDGCIPLALIVAPQSGTGKTMLGNIVAILATGHGPSMMPYSQDSEEMRKKVTSFLRADANVIVMDNITVELNSEILASALTTDEWVDRLLGRNEVLKLPQRATWIANGNNLRLGGDIPRRCYSIELDAETSQPWKRSGFHHPNLVDLVKRRRAELMWAVLVLIRAWVSAGKPAFSGPSIGGFSEWSNIIGGILENAGVEKFLANLDDMYDAANEEGTQWEAFLLGLQSIFNQSWFTTSQITGAFQTNPNLVDALPDELGSPYRSDGSIDARFNRTLGIELKKRVRTRYGSQQIYLAYQKNSHTKTSKWQVICGVAGTCGIPNTQSQNPVTTNISGGVKVPAPAAVPAVSKNKCYACGTINWIPRPDGSGVYCGTCHPSRKEKGK